MLNGYTGELGTMEDWIEWALNAMFNGYKTTARVVPEKTIDMLYQREVLDVEPQSAFRPDLRPTLEVPSLQGRKRAPVRPSRGRASMRTSQTSRPISESVVMVR
jgi:hypothetical protein